MKLVHITWNDSFSIDKWSLKELVVIESQKLMECHTVGYILSRTRQAVTICHTTNSEGMVCGAIQIPRKCIIKIEPIC